MNPQKTQEASWRSQRLSSTWRWIRSSTTEFDYRIPESLAGTLKVGMMVKVPFGRSTRDGYILSFAEFSDYHGELKEIIGVSTTRAHVPEHLVELGRWMADYYCCSQEQSIRTLLPAAVRSGAR